MIQIRKAIPKDQDSIWQIIQEVIAGRDSYSFAPDTSREVTLDYWCGADKHPCVEAYIMWRKL